VGLRGGHADVGDDDVGAVAPHLQQQVRRITRLPHDLEPGLREHLGEALAQQHGVLGDHDAHGISATTRVPAPGGLSTESLPPTPSTRPSSPRSPDPAPAAAPPTPSSLTSRTSSPPRGSARTTTDDACACLTTFAKASHATKYAAASTCGGYRPSAAAT